MFESDVDLIKGMDEGVAGMAAASAKLLHAIAEFDERGLWEIDGTSMTQWLSYRYALTYQTAKEWVRVARKLRSLPEVSAAYSEGKLSWDQVRPLTMFCTRETDEHWAKEAASLRAAGLWLEARRHQEQSRRQAVEAHRRRFLRKWWNETELYFEGMLTGDQAAAFEAAIDRRSEEILVVDDPIDPAEARCVDALHELVTRVSDESVAPTLVVHADASILTGEAASAPQLAETESGVHLCPVTIRRLACDARIEWNLEAGGRTVGIGRRGRNVPGAMARALRFRDRTCRFPGCERRRWLKVHHIVHWARGGGTDLGNLILLCHAHHRAVHEGGWSIRGDPVRALRFHAPAGLPLSSFAGGSLPDREVSASA
jgi:Domain of unknown function (DUF222)/HNH endonuclease